VMSSLLVADLTMLAIEMPQGLCEYHSI